MFNTLRAYFYAIRKWHESIIEDYEDENLHSMWEEDSPLDYWTQVQYVPDDYTAGETLTKVAETAREKGTVESKA